MNKIILIGFRCVGKTTIGKKLSEILNWDFFDLDEEIQKKAGKSIKELVEEKGWEYFRKLEKDEMKKLKNLKNVVIALGGGSIIHKEEMEELFKESFVVWLWATPEVILERIKKDKKTLTQRPSLKNLDLKSEIEEVLRERLPLYERFSHLRIYTDKVSVKEAVEKILEKLQED